MCLEMASYKLYVASPAIYKFEFIDFIHNSQTYIFSSIEMIYINNCIN